jgi:hypothetical protein
MFAGAVGPLRPKSIVSPDREYVIMPPFPPDVTICDTVVPGVVSHAMFADVGLRETARGGGGADAISVAYRLQWLGSDDGEVENVDGIAPKFFE